MTKYDHLHYEANDFALQLLMPEVKFKEFIKDVSASVSDIAKHFQVPTMAVRHRAKQLGYDGHNIY